MSNLIPVADLGVRLVFKLRVSAFKPARINNGTWLWRRAGSLGDHEVQLPVVALEYLPATDEYAPQTVRYALTPRGELVRDIDLRPNLGPTSETDLAEFFKNGHELLESVDVAGLGLISNEKVRDLSRELDEMMLPVGADFSEPVVEAYDVRVVGA